VSSESYPETLHLEVTNRCNFECEVCIRRTWSAKRTDLNIDIYNKIAESVFPQLRRLVICGFGEPFANANLVSMLRTAKEKLPNDSEVILTTNGSLLSPRISDKLVGRGLLSDLSFSIDTVDVEKLSRIRVEEDKEGRICNLAVVEPSTFLHVPVVCSLLGPRVLCDYVLVEFYSEPWFRWWNDVALLILRRILDDLPHQGSSRRPFLDDEVGAARVQVYRSHPSDRPIGHVGRDGGVPSLGHGRDLLRF